MTDRRRSAPNRLADLAVTAAVAAALLAGSVLTSVAGPTAAERGPPVERSGAPPAGSTAPGVGCEVADPCSPPGAASLRLTMEPRTGLCLG